ncbi:MAG: hypothetical protein Fur0034_20470 [Desulfuromonadia bacterium]
MGSARELEIGADRGIEIGHDLAADRNQGVPFGHASEEVGKIGEIWGHGVTLSVSDGIIPETPDEKGP